MGNVISLNNYKNTFTCTQLTYSRHNNNQEKEEKDHLCYNVTNYARMSDVWETSKSSLLHYLNDLHFFMSQFLLKDQ